MVLPDGRQVFYSLTNGKMLYGKQTICGTSFTFNTVNGLSLIHIYRLHGM